MPSPITYEMMLILKDKYDPYDLFEYLGLTIEDIVEAFDERIYELITDGTIEL